MVLCSPPHCPKKVQDAINNFKVDMVQRPLLVPYNPGQQLYIDTDASLMQLVHAFIIYQQLVSVALLPIFPRSFRRQNRIGHLMFEKRMRLLGRWRRQETSWKQLS